jgi:hypothetical protein
LFRDVGEGEAGALKKAPPDMNVIGRSGHRQSIEAAPPLLAGEQGGYIDGIGIEQVQDRADSVLELDEPVVVSPLSGPVVTDGAIEEVGRLPGREGRLDSLEYLIL